MVEIQEEKNSKNAEGISAYAETSQTCLRLQIGKRVVKIKQTHK